MAHTFDADRADRLEDPERFRYCSRDELLALLDPVSDSGVLDVGSGTGFYAREIAPFVASLLAVDIQSAMHQQFVDRGVPDSVAQLTASADDLPFETGAIDGAYTTMTFHEIATPAAIGELNRVLVDGGRLVTVDWSAGGEGDAGPPIEDRVTAATAAEQLRTAGFAVTECSERLETFTLVGTT